MCPTCGRAEGRITPVLNTGVIPSFLDQLSATIPVGTHAVLVWDGAGYHSASTSLRTPSNLTLVTLPPYAPDLNPAEQLWNHGKGADLANFAPRDAEHLRGEVRRSLIRQRHRPTLLASFFDHAGLHL